MPDYGFGVIALVGLTLRDRWIITAALLLVADWLICCWITAHVDPHGAWALKAISDTITATALACTFKIRGIILAAMLGLSFTFYILIGASLAFGSRDTQTYVNYYAWWDMLYLAFAICGVLAVCGFEDHGGKLARRRALDYLRRNRPAVLESHGAHREAPNSTVALSILTGQDR